MPKLGMTMEEGVLTEWFVNEGDEVVKGDPLFEVMTDKINIEVEAPESGVLLKVLADEGETVPVNKVIGYIGETGEAIDDVPPQLQDVKTETTDAVVAPAPQFAAQPAPAEKEKDTVVPRTVRATPSARRLARIHKIDLSTVTGTGPRGRIQARDVEQAAEQQKAQAPRERGVETAAPEKPTAEETARTTRSATEPAPYPAPAYTETVYQGIRQVIGERMVQSVREIPHVTLHRWANMERMLQFKSQWEDVVREEAGYKLSLNDLLVLACVRTLKRHPELNATLDEGSIRSYGETHIGMAVQTDAGLVVPVIRGANRMSLSEIVKALRDKIERAKNRKLTPEELGGGTFTISNLGGYGIELFTPIINAPQAAILGVGQMTVQPVWDGQSWQPVHQLPLSLSFDHRIVDGAPAAEFMQTLAEYLEQPQKLLI